MSHVHRLSPFLAAALLGTTAAVPLPQPERPAQTTANLAANPTEPGHVPERADVPVQTFAANLDDLNASIERGLTAARALIADPRPYKIDADELSRMVSAVEAIASAPDAMNIAIPADAFALLAECVRADRSRAFRKGAAWAVAEVVSDRAAKVMFAFSEARRQGGAVDGEA
jgi:hypothetical protein